MREPVDKSIMYRGNTAAGAPRLSNSTRPDGVR